MAVDSGDRWVEVDTLLLEAMIQSAIGPPSDAERNARAVASIADEVGARHLRALALNAGALPALRLGRPALAMRRVREAREILEGLGVDAELAEVDLAEAAVHLDRGAWRRVAGAADAGEARARRSEWRLLEPQGALMRGRAHLGASRLGDAHTELERCAVLAQAANAPGPLSVARAAMTQVRLLLGERAGAAVVEEDDPVSLAIWLENQAFVAWGSGDTARASEAFAGAAERWAGLGLTIWLARAGLLEAEVLRRTRRLVAARRKRAQAELVLQALHAPANSLAELPAPFSQPTSRAR